MNTEQEPELTRGYQVQVDDNFHFMREDERWVLGNFATYEEAVAASKGLIEAFFSEASVGRTAEELYDGFVAVGDDPFIIPFGGEPTPRITSRPGTTRRNMPLVLPRFGILQKSVPSGLRRTRIGW